MAKYGFNLLACPIIEFEAWTMMLQRESISRRSIHIAFLVSMQGPLDNLHAFDVHLGALHSGNPADIAWRLLVLKRDERSRDHARVHGRCIICLVTQLEGLDLGCSRSRGHSDLRWLFQYAHSSSLLYLPVSWTRHFCYFNF